MSGRNRIPPSLEPYLKLPPEASLILLASTLGCNATWLTALFVGSTLAANTPPNASDNGEGRTSMVLVSWMRDLTFWKDMIRRTAGFDIFKSQQQGSFVFIDGLGLQHLDQPLRSAEGAIGEALTKMSSDSSTSTMLILDSPDILLATGSASAQELHSFTMRLRSRVHSTVLACSADIPLISVSAQSVPMDIETAAFATQQAHAAQCIMSTRELASGAAKDVSGVLSITLGGEYDDDDRPEADLRETEMLYLVQRDGAVRVFGRGEAG